MLFLFWFAQGVLRVRLLEQRERLLFLSVFRDKALPVVAVLQAGDVARGRAEIHEDPRYGAAKLRNLPKHCELVFEHIDLLFFGPPLIHGPVIAELGFW